MNNDIGQDELAKRLDVTKTYISLIENNKKEPSLALLRKFSEIFHIPLWILLLEDSDFEKNPSKADIEMKNEIEALIKTYFYEKISAHRDDNKIKI